MANATLDSGHGGLITGVPGTDMPSLTHLALDLHIFGQLTYFRPRRNYLTHFFHIAMYNFYARFLQEIDN